MAGQGGCAFELSGGFGVGLGVGFGVGAFVGLAVGFGVGSAVARGVGVVVRRGVGSAVGRGVPSAGPGSWVDVGLLGVGPGVDPGPPVGWAGTSGDALDSAVVGLARGDPDGLAAGVADVELDGDAADDGLLVNPGLPLAPDSPGPVGADAVEVGTWAMLLGPGARSDRCWSSTPPMPSATVARTRFRRPRLRMRRTR